VNVEIKFSAKHQKYEGFVNGKIVTRRGSASACQAYIQAKFQTAVQVATAQNAPIVAMQASNNKVAYMRDRLHTEYAAACADIKKIYPSLDWQDPRIEWYYRGGAAGKANGRRNAVMFNEPLLADNPQHIRQVVRHELAHIVVARQYPESMQRTLTMSRFGRLAMRRGVKSHGPEWKAVMYALGVPALTTHNLDVSKVKVRHVRAKIKCDCGNVHEVTMRVLRKIFNGVQYRCRRSGSVLLHSNYMGMTK
jgi:predicted SprT family Zn-dependent metalloprotease